MIITPALASNLTGRTVVVFGGTSGIGLAAAIQAKAAGAKVVVIGSNAARAEQAAKEHGLDGWRAADVTRREAVEAALADIPVVDHLVLLAGTFVTGSILTADVDHLRRAFDERIWASINAIRILGDRLSKTGSITFISGALADRPNAHGTAVIGAASAAMESLARGLALELAPIRVNTLSPGPIDTPIFSKALGEGRDAYVASLEQALPLRRIGTAEEAGAATVFLMTNTFMNGAVLNVDGGARLV
ncbi:MULTISPECIES: SDR family oxidoreductase [unclassified Pseudomonas]|uniref:SDR family oxidoreductase n=1 Tax=unclassified Pseudomonas TaxID=196821 RepID=UPI00119A8C92|nr:MULTISPECIES: SDR family oxidoreductase [unclassified Pseudomonas]TWC18412.1 NAD(P)-dependent dehydrogenase (short-subunit alcohol dehydrogenase family) [Pseudomonas sp. SJZ075]TWC23417.1 NAD(P)-dependent dehydrogenase (short-subunit alcohol dehydrogenase family) [Pseudomonas sp. SJZ074]TWC34817.1 NAD(P)-dependent dehydrogenase (short-subunit alcohol dehydrogenase family) [Pseudomonas sp. SJZ078]TWC40635.1 NAD(P)-dependent dehydrogenase (short-subunit alcohol dehydrogenase family) [Pseudomon